MRAVGLGKVTLRVTGKRQLQYHVIESDVIRLSEIESEQPAPTC